MVRLQHKSLYLFFLFLLTFSAHGQRLNAGDGVRLTFYNISDPISGDYFVHEDGRIQLPYVGLIRVSNRNFAEVKSEITVKYDSLYRDPELTIQPLYKIKILGEVRKPGIYYATGVEKLSDLLALAGGETDDANLKKIYFVQGGKKINVNAREMLQNGRLLKDLGLSSGTQIYVPRRWLNIRKASVILSGIAVAATVYGVFLR